MAAETGQAGNSSSSCLFKLLDCCVDVSGIPLATDTENVYHIKYRIIRPCWKVDSLAEMAGVLVKKKNRKLSHYPMNKATCTN